MAKYNVLLHKPRVEANCVKCRPLFKVEGDVYISYDNAEEGIDGKPAFRLFWKCHCAGHVRPIGYTRPVDFTRGEPEYKHTYDELHLDEDPTEDCLTHHKYY